MTDNHDDPKTDTPETGAPIRGKDESEESKNGAPNQENKPM